MGSYGGGEEEVATGTGAIGSYGDEGGGGGGGGETQGPMLRWDPGTSSWVRDGQQRDPGAGAPGAIPSPVKQQKSVSFGRPPSMKLKKTGAAGGAASTEPWAGANEDSSAAGSGQPPTSSSSSSSRQQQQRPPPPPNPGGPSPPKIKGGEFVRRSVPMNPAVIDAMSRREVIHALEKRGVAHDDLLEEDAEDDALKRRLKLHACASRGQMEAAEASATEATRREYEKTLETPAGEWF